MKKILAYLLILSCTASLFGCAGAGTLEEGEALAGDYVDSQEETIYYPSEEDSPKEKPQKETEKTPEKQPEKESEKKPATEKPAETQKPAESTPATDTSETVPDYKSISCRSNSSIDWNTVRFENPGTELCLQLAIPSDWEVVKKTDQTYHFQRNGKEIAALSSSAFPKPKKTFDGYSLTDIERLMVYQDVFWYQTEGNNTFFHHLEFNAKFKDQTFDFFLRMNYAELDKTACNYMMRNAQLITEGESIRPYSQSNGAKAILFLNGIDAQLAEVHTHLNDMFHQSGKELFAVSEYLPQGSMEDFPSLQYCQEAIRKGQYSHVFVNGFYELADCSKALGLLKECCAASNTELVLFPTYSEPWRFIDEAREIHPDIPLLDWSSEVHSLITSGGSFDALCFPNGRNSPTAVGGYAGAHMVYRTLFLEKPPMISNTSSYFSNIKKTYPANYFNKDGSETIYRGKTYSIQ